MISTDKLAQAFSIGAAPATDEYRFATVTQTEGGTYVKLSNTKTQTRCTDLVGVSVGDRVQVCIKANGSCVIIGVIGESEIDRKLAAMEPVELYNNASGTNGYVPLNETAENFSRIDICFGYDASSMIRKTVTVYEPNNKYALLDYAYKATSNIMQVATVQYTISGSEMTRHNGFYQNHGADSSGGAVNANHYVYKVIGYR